MILFIDTSFQEEIRLAIINNNKVSHKEIMKVGFAFSEKILTGIDMILKKSKVHTTDINSILVVTGPGRFSALRTGVSVANTLAWSLSIPIFGLEAVEATDGREYWSSILRQTNKINMVKNKKSNKYIIPAYAQEPNITTQKIN